MVKPIDNSKRSYEVSFFRGKFRTQCRIDGFWVCSWFSKTKRRAIWKGDQFVVGKREPRKLVWAWHSSAKSPFLALAKQGAF